MWKTFQKFKKLHFCFISILNKQLVCYIVGVSPDINIRLFGMHKGFILKIKIPFKIIELINNWTDMIDF